MIHEQSLVDQLNALPVERFDGESFRTTRGGADPIAPSNSGGRWAPPPEDAFAVSVLYTSLDRDGSIAEVVSFLTELNLIPGPRPLNVSWLRVSTGKTLRLARTCLERLGIDRRATVSEITVERKKLALLWLFWSSTD